MKKKLTFDIDNLNTPLNNKKASRMDWLNVCNLKRISEMSRLDMP